MGVGSWKWPSRSVNRYVDACHGPCPTFIKDSSLASTCV